MCRQPCRPMKPASGAVEAWRWAHSTRIAHAEQPDIPDSRTYRAHPNMQIYLNMYIYLDTYIFTEQPDIPDSRTYRTAGHTGQPDIPDIPGTPEYATISEYVYIFRYVYICRTAGHTGQPDIPDSRAHPNTQLYPNMYIHIWIRRGLC